MLGAWRFITIFGTVSLLADFVYEGARSITGPLLASLGATTLSVACALVVAERVGKAVRSPAKDTLLSHAAAVTGRGRGFAVHKALDQIGAIIGPLTVAGVLAITGNAYGPALGALALPGVAALALLVWLRLRVPDPADYEPHGAVAPHPKVALVGADRQRRSPQFTPGRWAPMPSPRCCRG